MNDNTLMTLEPAWYFFKNKIINLVLSGLLRPLHFMWCLTWLILQSEKVSPIQSYQVGRISAPLRITALNHRLI